MTPNARSVLYPRKPLSTSYGSVIMLYKGFLHEAINWLSGHNIHIHLEEKSFLFGLFKNQENEVNKKVQVGKDQEKAQSEKDSHSKNRGGKKPN